MKNHAHIADLIAKKNKGTITPDEWQALEAWANENDHNKRVYDKATNDQFLLDNFEIYELFKGNETWGSIEEKLFKTKTVHLFAQNWLRYAASLALLLVSLSVGWYYFTRQGTGEVATFDEIAKPGTEKATLLLSDGREINLEEALQRQQIAQPGATVTASRQGVSYISDSDKGDGEPLVYNELIVPRGGRYVVTLADGTDVWINAGSKLKFPVSFTDSTREVFLTGEAYFEVEHNGKPFIVHSGAMDVRVLGTTFNISAYEEDEAMKATLVEGSVKVSIPRDGAFKTLAPNDQAIVEKSGMSLAVMEVNTGQYTSWVQGKLEFDNENLDVVMRRLSRWYDFEYQFENEEAKKFHFTARLNNNQSISSILEMLEMTTNVKFEIRKNAIIVL